MYGGPVESVLLGVETVPELNSENLQGGGACCRRTEHGPPFLLVGADVRNAIAKVEGEGCRFRSLGDIPVAIGREGARL